MGTLNHNFLSQRTGHSWPHPTSRHLDMPCARHPRLSISCKAHGSNSPDPEEAQEEIVLCNWNLPEFWDGVTRDAGVPATYAVAINWVLTDSFITSKLPEVANAQCMLTWLLPIALLDTLLWRTPSHRQQQSDIQPVGQAGEQEQVQALTERLGGLDLYRNHRRAACAAQERTLPPVQKNVLLVLQACAQQLAIQGVLTVAAIRLLQAVETEFPGVLPQLHGLPGMTDVDPSLVAMAACTGVMVAMVSYRVRCSAHAFHPDHLERSTCAFMATLGEQPPAATAPWLAPWEQRRPGAEAGAQAGWSPPDLGPRRLSAALSAGREALVLTSCTMVFLQTGSIIASAWVAYVAANIDRRLAR